MTSYTNTGQLATCLECPDEVQKYVEAYWTRHQGTIMHILQKLNSDGYLTVTFHIIPGHRQVPTFYFLILLRTLKGLLSF